MWFATKAGFKLDLRSPFHLPSMSYVCGHCNNRVASESGCGSAPGYPRTTVYICHHCDKPTIFIDRNEGVTQIPAPLYGTNIQDLPDNIRLVYDESRACMQHSCPTAAVMLCRKLLMAIAIEEGASEGMQFINYVDYLADKSLVPPKMKVMLDRVRKLGNDVNHELLVASPADASLFLNFLGTVLKLNYAFIDRDNNL